ncbi:hypothetical protein KJ359_010740 [Pestalotiopsis sp. 9143b]|nr:hypothetical protein KJ359_010740 [Pestalotiopsis sp. 9143b]
MAPWSADEKDRLIRLIDEFGESSRPSASSLGVIQNWAKVVQEFNGDKDEDDDGFRTKNSMQSQWSRAAKVIVEKTKDVEFNFANNTTHGAMLLQRYEHSVDIEDAPPPATRSTNQENEERVRTVERDLDRIADELLDILANVEDKAERDRMVDYFNQKFDS